MVANSEHDDVLVAHEGRSALDRCQRFASAGHDREILAGGRSDEVAVSEMTKIAVPVDEGQTEATTAPQGELIADQDAAVAAEDHWKETIIEKTLDAIREPGGIALDRLLVTHPIARLPDAAVAGRNDNTTIVRVEPRQEAVVAQRAWLLVNARRGAVDQREAATADSILCVPFLSQPDAPSSPG